MGNAQTARKGKREMADMRSRNPIVANAMSATARNAAGDLLVTFNTITERGVERVQAKMSPSYFETWAAKVGVRQQLQGVWLSLMKGDEGYLFLPEQKVTVRGL